MSIVGAKNLLARIIFFREKQNCVLSVTPVSQMSAAREREGGHFRSFQ